jgi:hypothetical protein
MGKFNQLLTDLHILENRKDNNVVNNLLKKPIKDTGINMPNITNQYVNGYNIIILSLSII